MTTKIQVINDAYTELRISGLTVSPSPSDITLALNLLEAMMAELKGLHNFNVNYNFEVTPNVNSRTNVELTFKRMMVTNLAVRLIPAFNKVVPQELGGQASQSLSAAIGIVSAATLQMIQPPRRMPIGSGNSSRGVYWDRYSVPIQNAPNAPVTNYILQGETLDYSEDFSAFLGANTISSYTIVADQLLTIDTSANASPLITYTITAPDSESAQGPWQQVMITITDSAGRVLVRLINFEVTTPPDVGS